MEDVIKRLLKRVEGKLLAAKQEHLEAVKDRQDWGIDEWRELNPEYELAPMIKALTLHHVNGEKPKDALKKVNPSFRGTGAKVISALERKLALAVLTGDDEVIEAVRDIDLPTLLAGHKSFRDKTDDKLVELDAKAAEITGKSGDVEPGAAVKTKMKVSPSSNTQSEAVISMAVAGEVEKQKPSKALGRSLDTRTNILRERVRRAALRRWEQVRGEAVKPKSTEDDPVADFLRLMKRYGKGAFGLISGIELSALGDGEEALQALLTRLGRPEQVVIRNRFEALMREGFTEEVAAMAIAACFLMVERDGVFPKKPKEDDEGLIREHCAMDLYDFATSLDDPAMDEDDLRVAYWALTKRVRKLKSDIGKFIKLPDEEE